MSLEWLKPVLGLIALAVLAISAIRRRERIVGKLHEFAVGEGLQKPEAHSSLSSGFDPTTWSGVEATWEGLPVRFKWIAGRRGVPTRVMLSIGRRGPSRLIVRKDSRLLDRFVAPPIVERLSSQFLVVRADDTVLAERVVKDSAVEKALLIIFEELRVDRKGVHVTVPIYDHDAVKQIVAEAWTLAGAVAKAIPAV